MLPKWKVGALGTSIGAVRYFAKTLLFALSLLVASPALALDVKKEYERELIQWALRRESLTPDERPAGKTISRVVVVREDIIAKSDPWPGLLNYVHVKTRDYVVRQEVLLHAGDKYDQRLAAETERNLRKLFILAVARVVACRDLDPRKVVLLVVTKDLWSLRLNMIYSQTGSMVHYLDFTPTEGNFLGRNKRLSLHVLLSQLDLGSFTFFDGFALGARYEDQRLLTTRLRLYLSADAYIDGEVPCGGWVGEDREVGAQWCPTRGNGALAGGRARIRLERPLFSLATRWSFFVDGWLDVAQIRSYLQDGSLATVSDERIDAADRSHIPLAYDSRRFVGSFGITRSIGRKLKHDLTWGMLVYRLRFEAPDNFPYGAADKIWFEASVLRRSETASAFYFNYAIRPTRFVRLNNVDSLGLSEDFPLGPQLALELRLAQDLVDPSAGFVELLGSVAYTFNWGKDLLKLAGDFVTRYQLQAREGDPERWANTRLSAAVINVTPPFWIGRLHTRAAAVFRRDDLDHNATVFDSSLVRGYPTTNLRGRDAFAFNVEYRTRPINLFTLHLATALFYDGGTVFGAWLPGQPAPDFVYRHSVGIGLRALFPQFDRESLRVDIAFPLTADLRGSVGTFISLSFGPAFVGVRKPLDKTATGL